jgi:hypothetical protein
LLPIPSAAPERGSGSTTSLRGRKRVTGHPCAWWWRGLDSNQRRRSQRIYSPSPLATRAPLHCIFRQLIPSLTVVNFSSADNGCALTCCTASGLYGATGSTFCVRTPASFARQKSARGRALYHPLSPASTCGSATQWYDGGILASVTLCTTTKPIRPTLLPRQNATARSLASSSSSATKSKIASAAPERSSRGLLQSSLPAPSLLN